MCVVAQVDKGFSHGPKQCVISAHQKEKGTWMFLQMHLQKIRSGQSKMCSNLQRNPGGWHRGNGIAAMCHGSGLRRGIGQIPHKGFISCPLDTEQSPQPG